MLQVLVYGVGACAAVAACGALYDFVRGHRPNWVALIGVAVTELVAVVAVCMAMGMFFAGQSQASAIMAWGYCVCAVLLLPVAFVWGIGEPSKWANVVLIVALAGVTGLVFRIQELW